MKKFMRIIYIPHFFGVKNFLLGVIFLFFGEILSGIFVPFAGIANKVVQTCPEV
jgi:hypothetical protein